MKIILEKCTEPLHLEAVNEEGNRISLHGGTLDNGEKLGMSPMQLLLASLAGCTSMDILDMLEKQRQELEDFTVVVDGKRENKETLPKIFEKINLHFIFKGKLNSKKTERAIALSMEKYCSVARMLEAKSEITWSYSIEEV